MQLGFLAAGVLAAITGVVHSVLGERLIFRHLRRGTVVPTLEAPPPHQPDGAPLFPSRARWPIIGSTHFPRMPPCPLPCANCWRSSAGC